MSITSNSTGTSATISGGRKTLIVVSHTHWDREWYLTFQQYRVKLVRLVDRLLNILDSHPDYAYFMLDGQTIVLEDYLEIRPDRRADLVRHIQSGRLLIGPWYILADQFLVSGEAHIQNLLFGRRISNEFGATMPVGYVPDPFGHTSQTPQILRGFGIDSAVFWRGVGPEIKQVEFIWEAPDGTTVDGVHLPGTANIGGYSTALGWNSGPEIALEQLKSIKSLVIDRAKSDVALLMNGNDHVEPTGELPAILQKLRQIFVAKGQDYELVHGTLPMYLQLARQSGVWQQPETPRHVGEFRDSSLAHLLPGVLSSRMPIKQRNAFIERTLERETGAALAWASTLPGLEKNFDPASLRGLYRTAWKYLLQNHPHDSICGCSVDQVHAEMETRFDWAEQIAEEVKQESRKFIAQHVDTSGAANLKTVPLVVFNSVPFTRTELAELPVSTPDGSFEVAVTDEQGNLLPHRISNPEKELLFTMDIPAYAMAGMTAQAGDEGRVMDHTMASVEFVELGGREVGVDIMAVYQSAAPTNPELMIWAAEQLQKYAELGIENFKLAVYRQTGARLEFLAKDVPALGYKTFYLRPRQEGDISFPSETSQPPQTIENEFYELSVDPTTGHFQVRDKTSGEVLSGLNRFRDGGDAGDEYNYSPPEKDEFFEYSMTTPQVSVTRSGLVSSITVSCTLNLPAGLNADRTARTQPVKHCKLQTTATLVAGQRRVNFTTRFANRANDHRLQVLFPLPFKAETVSAEQAFDVVERSTALPKFDRKTWREDPQSTASQKNFVSAYNAAKNFGITLFNQGLPEYDVVAQADGNSALAITLLRCVGWLSRNDLATRRDHAGPGLPTPGAQLQGEHVFHYALMPHQGTWLEASAQQAAQAFNHPLGGVASSVQKGILPSSSSLLEIQPAALALSTIKPAEDGRGIIVRLWNPADYAIPDATLKFYRSPVRVTLENLAEENVLSELALGGEQRNQVSFGLAAKRIATLRVEF